MGLVSLPNTLANGTPADGSQVRANDDAIVTVVNGGIDKDNLSATPAFPGTCISNVAGSRVPTDRIEDLAVTTAKLAVDASAGSPAAAVTLATQIKDGIIPAAKLVANTIPASKLKVTEYTVLCSTLMGSATKPTTTVPVAKAVDTINGLTSAQLYPLALWVSRGGATPLTQPGDVELFATYSSASGDSRHYITLCASGTGMTGSLTDYTLHLLYLERT